MRVVCQRVSQAKVSVLNNVVGQINQGFLLYIGFHINDDQEIVKKMADKIVKLRIFEDENGKLNLNLGQVNGQILAVSQFTLYGNVIGNNRPSFIEACRPDKAIQLYEMFVMLLKEKFHVETGVFQAHMLVESINDGPVTILIEY
ncbi:MAG: D-aminoacyl-tRNA deacylase [Acholeplasmataceae bacterium]